MCLSMMEHTLRQVRFCIFLLLDGAEAFGVDGVEALQVLELACFLIELVFLESWQLKMSIFVGPFFFDKT